MKTIKYHLLLLALALLVSGCPKSNADLGSRDRLLKRVAGYHDALSWRDWTAAAKFIAPESRADFQEHANRLSRGYTLDNWMLRDVKPAEAEGKMAVVVYRTFLMPPSVTLQSDSVLLTWVFLEREWYLEGPPF